MSFVFNRPVITQLPQHIKSGLVLSLDVQDPSSYPENKFISVMDNTSNWYDLTNNGNVASLSNISYYNSDEFGKRWLDFNGSNALGIIPENSVFNTQTVSVEVWVRTNNLNQNGFFFEKGNVNTQYSLFQEGTNIQWRQILNGGINTLTVASSVLSTTKFTQLVGTFSSGNRKIYVNGVQVASDSAAGTISTNTNGVSIGVYGGFNGSRSYWYNGSIAIVRVYNKQLTAEEILQNYNANRYRYELSNIIIGSESFITPSLEDNFDINGGWSNTVDSNSIITGSEFFSMPSLEDNFDINGGWYNTADINTALTGSQNFVTPIIVDSFETSDGW